MTDTSERPTDSLARMVLQAAQKIPDHECPTLPVNAAAVSVMARDAYIEATTLCGQIIVFELSAARDANERGKLLVAKAELEGALANERLTVLQMRAEIERLKAALSDKEGD